MSNQPPIDADDLVADVDFPAAQRSPEFQELRKTHRGFVFPLAVAFLVWYLLYVVLAMYAPQLFAIQVIGNVNLGVVLGRSSSSRPLPSRGPTCPSPTASWTRRPRPSGSVSSPASAPPAASTDRRTDRCTSCTPRSRP